LTNLLKKDIKFEWTAECQTAFDELKHVLTSSPLLQYPDFQKPFNIMCGDSNFAVGSILSQGDINLMVT
jgi:hypothetical protein